MTCDLQLRDARSVARIINLAHRFNCRCVRIAADAAPAGTTASFAFEGPDVALSRLRAQIARIVAYESPSVTDSPEGTS
jgi:hypothetical protein